jgi:transposase
MCYSLDFRKKVLSVKARDNLTLKAVSTRFDIGTASVSRWLKRIKPDLTRNKPAIKIDMQLLQKDVDKYPHDYQFERAQRFNVSNSCILFALRRLGISYKKNATSSKCKSCKTSHI